VSQVVATGGTVTDITDGGVEYRVHTFSTSDDLVVTSGGEVEVLVVAGGGGGGAFTNRGAGGGGAGGYVTVSSLAVTATTYPVVVGAGGAGSTLAGVRGTNGSNSSFASTTATGGGGGGSQNNRDGNAGGSGGGAGGAAAGQDGTGGAGVAGQGNDGGPGTGGGATDARGGGGGGASSAGDGTVGNGGAGITSTITGVPVGRAGGGVGDARDSPVTPVATDGGGTTGQSGAANTGGGGGTGITTTGGGAGGSGVVIIRYVLFPPFSPDATVTIDGQDFTGDTIDQVTVTRGRDTVYSEPQPGYASLRLIDKTGAGLDIEVGDPIIIDVAPNVTVFAGTITDWTAQLYDAGLRNSPAAVYQITAVGPLFILNRRVIYFAGRTAEKDAERIDNIVDTAANDVYDPALIDPGVFDLAALAAADAGYNALTAAQNAASSGAGILFETADGFVGFADADRRPANRKAGVYQIPANVVTADLSTDSRLADLTNRVTVTYSGGAVTESDTDSISRFGEYDRNIDTQLVNQSNAEARAEQFLETHAVPTVNTSPVTIRVDGLDAALANDLLDLDINDAVRVPLPNTLLPTNRTGFIEQIVTRFDPFRAEIVLTVSDFRLSVGSERWGQVDPTIAWEDVSATLTWEDATEVTT
jgi:hypothetical protein